MTHSMFLDKWAPASVLNIRGMSRVQEERRVFNEELRVLVLRAVMESG